MIDLGRPIAEVLIDGVPVACSRVAVAAARTEPVGLAKFNVLREQDQPVTLRSGAPLIVRMGYELAGVQTLFEGRVRMVGPADQAIVATALDMCRDLEDLRVVRAFRNATCQDVLRWCADHHQFDIRMPTTDTRRSRLFVVANESILRVVERARLTWGAADWDVWWEPEQGLWFGPWNETSRAQAEILRELVHGVDLDKCVPTNGRSGTAEMMLDPRIVHSSRLRLRHDGLWGQPVTVRIDRAEHLVADGQVAKTRFEWTTLEN
jgi:hypothetical protein